MRYLVLAWIMATTQAWAAGCNQYYCTSEEKTDTHVDILIRSITDVPVAVTISMTTDNAMPTRMGKIEVELKPRSTVRAVRVIQVDRAKPWGYQYETSWRLSAQEKSLIIKEYPYRVPLPSGMTAKVTQGQGGAFSHQGAEQHGVDLEVPVGTPVLAARGGVVVNVKADSDEGGPLPSFGPKGNFVIVQHVDGTFSRYYHLEKNSVPVAIGQSVREGQLIGRAGATGFAKGPHLHFDVARLEGAAFVTVPFLLEAKEGMFREIATGTTVTTK